MRRAVFRLFLIPFLLFYALPVSAVEKEERNRQDEMIYFIMVDRFNNGDTSNDYEVDINNPKAYQGGDLKGITKKLDYIKDMGFTTIWLTPIFENEQEGYHGYWISDFKKIEEHFGTLKDLKELVNEAHKRNMKVILDFVVNHTGYQHEWLNDPSKKDWFHAQKEIKNWSNQEEVENGRLSGLPDLNQGNPEVREYLLETAKWWIEETDIDGYRLDTVKHVPKDFWTEFTREVKSVKEDFFLIGEVWDKDPRYIASYEKTNIDSFVDYPLYEELTTVFSEPDRPLTSLYNVWNRNAALYQSPNLLGTFLDNHDNVRFTRQAIQNQQHPGTRLKLALTYLYTAPGIPIVYYGTEIALDGGEDPDNRRLMNFRTDDVLVKHIEKLSEIRRNFKSLTNGNMELLYDQDGMAVFKRQFEEETTFIAINNTSKSQKVELDPAEIGQKQQLTGLLSGDIWQETNGKYEIVLDRESADVYNISEKTGLNIPLISVFITIPILFIIFIYLANKKGKKLQE
ncbi:alpha-amylase family glycosyl hydrolase [Metabacillus arenae]|uniref:Alpha-amylase n=1 Tax=Metabacillus arenae TaxID=2771434 RepID=A0A926NG07_9BACI|nr:alpha-amylase family glycosyl hydrolase [Metabacillus arenae]MBD1380591.1 alpha-amylase [Metabacillus arenae]